MDGVGQASLVSGPILLHVSSRLDQLRRCPIDAHVDGNVYVYAWTCVCICACSVYMCVCMYVYACRGMHVCNFLYFI